MTAKTFVAPEFKSAPTRNVFIATYAKALVETGTSFEDAFPMARKAWQGSEYKGTRKTEGLGTREGLITMCEKGEVTEEAFREWLDACSPSMKKREVFWLDIVNMANKIRNAKAVTLKAAA